MDYKQAGVDIEEGYRAVSRYRELSAATANKSVLNGIGSFAGMYSLKEIIAAGKGMDDPVLVSGTDGVGTKLDIAFKLKKYDTVGIDCVAMCVNDILCHGARPLFFLDYLACGKLDAAVAADLVKGVAAGCRETGTVLLGGETAEMPGFYDEGKYDIAGFAVGIVDRSRILEGEKIRPGDTLVGIASSGVHSNGFSLIRRALPNLDEDFGGMPLGRALLEPTRLYVKPILALLETIEVRGMAHITGGGFLENIPRIFPERGEVSPPAPALRSSASPLSVAPPRNAPLAAVVREGTWTIPPIFNRLAYGVKTSGAGELSGGAAEQAGAELLKTDPALKRLMFNTYNMGIGFVLALEKANVKRAIEFLDSKGYPAWEIGQVEARPESGEGFRFA